MLKKILWSLLAFIFLAILGIILYLRSTVPNYNTDIHLDGLRDEVEVIYDSFAIPHIYAQNEEDLFRAFGYIHAQDRLFQMEILRRLADGRLSEIVGEAALPTDKFFRTLDLRTHAKIAIRNHDKNSGAYKAAQAYIKGINNYLREGKPPLEYKLAGIPKKDFTLEDMEMITGYMGYTFEGAFKTEPLATKIANELGPSYLQDIFDAWPDSLYKIPLKSYNSKLTEEAIKLSTAVLSINDRLPFPPLHGSNAWLLDGTKTASKKPILSNDTHIAFAQPSIWYEAHLECPTLKVYGNFLAGVAFPALGHTDAGAWGITMFKNDEADFYQEKVNPKNPKQVWNKNQWVDLEIRKEVIKVKDQKDVVLEVKKSKHGYILNEVFTELKNTPDPVALWWVYHQLPSKHLEVFYGLAKSSNVLQAQEAVKPLTAPGLNFMWADTAGNIAWWAAGRLPLRPKHVNPMLILDGSTGEDDFLGWAPFESNPKHINPSSGVLYSANNQPSDMGSGLVPGYYAASNRARRIQELLYDNTNKWTTETLRPIINDNTSPTTAEMSSNMLNLLGKNQMSVLEAAAIAELEGWEGTHELNDIAPTIFYRWQYFMIENTFKDELGQDAFELFNINLNLKRNMSVFIKNRHSKWWDNIETPSIETQEMILRKSFTQAIEALRTQLGEDISQWNWSQVHSITHRHPLGLVPGMGKWFNVGPIPIAGGRETINNMDFILDSTGVNKVIYGPALRRIIDMANTDMGYSVNPTGQSGHIMSQYYDDQAEMFANGGFRGELKNRQLIEANSIGKTNIRP